MMQLKKKKAKDGENSKRDRNERKKGIYFTREDEELGDLGIAQEGGCVQRGALLCVLREEDSQLVLACNIVKIQERLNLNQQLHLF